MFREPWVLGIIIIVAILLFAAPKLPGMARSLGQSMRIIKSEVKEMKNDGKQESASAAPAAPAPTAPAAPVAPEPPVEGKIVNNPAQGNISGEGTGTGTGAQS
nr:Sec-independent protein translocase subunit TatA [Arthrobacter alpinus]